MEMSPSRKKIVLAAILTSGLTLAISQAAFAEAAKPAPAGPQDKPAGRPCQMQPNSEMEKAHDKFLTETMAIRKEMAEKNAVLRALLNAGTPDTAKASQVAGELFELREKMRAKAKEAGLPLPMLMGHCGEGMDGQGPMGHGMMGKHHKMMQ
jgi:zinc resistance-associated protein